MGFEPTTYCLRSNCSTVEPQRHDYNSFKGLLTFVIFGEEVIPFQNFAKATTWETNRNYVQYY